MFNNKSSELFAHVETTYMLNMEIIFRWLDKGFDDGLIERELQVDTPAKPKLEGDSKNVVRFN